MSNESGVTVTLADWSELKFPSAWKLGADSNGQLTVYTGDGQALAVFASGQWVHSYADRAQPEETA